MFLNKFYFKNFTYNKLNEILILLISFIYLLNLNSLNSFKFIFIIQFVIILFLYRKNFKINFIYLPFLFFPFIFLLWNNEIKYFAFLITISVFITFFNPINFNKIDYKFNNTIYFLFLFFLFITANEISSKSYFFEHIYVQMINEYNLLSEHNFFERVINDRLRFSYYNLDANYASILILMIYNLLFFKRQKNYIIKFTLFTFFLIYFTQSKSGLIFYSISLLLFKFDLSLRKQMIIFFIFNFLIFFSSHLFFKNFKSPYVDVVGEGEIKDDYLLYQSNVYIEEICQNKNFDKVKFITNCNPTNQVIYGILGVSTYLKLYSIGFVAESIFENFYVYLLPNAFEKISKNTKKPNYFLNNYLSAHNIVLKGVGSMGIIFFSFFLIAIYIYFKRQKNYNLLPTIMASSFIGIDVFLFLPILLISSFEFEKK